MADHIVQGDERITSITELTEEAMRPTDFEVLAALNAPKKRGPGRPKGSRNRPKVDPGVPGSGPMQMRTPTRRTTSTSESDSDEERARRLQAKSEKSRAYADRIVTELNDQIMLAFISMGVPAPLLYKNGQGPAPKLPDSNLTPFGQRIAVSPMVAKPVASFLAELEFSEAGTKAVTAVTDSQWTLIIKGVVAVGAVVYYLNGLNQIRKEFEPLINQFREAQQQAANGSQARDHTTVGGLQ